MNILLAPELDDFPFDEMTGGSLAELTDNLRKYFEHRVASDEYIESVVNIYTQSGILEPNTKVMANKPPLFSKPPAFFKPEKDVETHVEILSFVDEGAMHLDFGPNKFRQMLLCTGKKCPMCMAANVIAYVARKNGRHLSHEFAQKYRSMQFLAVKVYVHENEGHIAEGEYDWTIRSKIVLDLILNNDADHLILRIKDKSGYPCYDDCVALIDGVEYGINGEPI